MNKTELVQAILDKKMEENPALELKKEQAKFVVDAALDVIAETLKQGDAVQILGFGTFKVSERKARQGRNPRTGETIEIPAAKIPAFVAGKALKDALK